MSASDRFRGEGLGPKPPPSGPGFLLLGEHGDRIPILTYRFEHCAAPTRLVEGQVIGKVNVGHRAPQPLDSQTNDQDGLIDARKAMDYVTPAG